MKILRGNLWRAVATALLGLLVLYPAFLHADEIRPAMLQIEEREGGWIDVTWKIPVRGDRRLALTPVLPDFFERAGPPSARRTPNGASVEYSAYRTGGQSLTGATLRIDGLATIPTDVLVRVALQDGSEHSTILRAGNSSYTIPEQATRGDVALAYWVTGTIHILEGSDHLLFLLTLLLIVSGFWPLVKTVTAFTIAHSLTLALATLGIVNIPPAPTEAVISLSILLLAVEAVRKNSGEVTVSERYPWVIAFAFGLVHGLGFAGALSEIGVPQNEVPLALLMFNVGVETGQLIFVAAVSLLLAAAKKVARPMELLASRSAPYAIGGIAAFWTIQRTVSFI